MIEYIFSLNTGNIVNRTNYTKCENEYLYYNQELKK